MEEEFLTYLCMNGDKSSSLFLNTEDGELEFFTRVYIENETESETEPFEKCTKKDALEFMHDAIFENPGFDECYESLKEELGQ